MNYKQEAIDKIKLELKSFKGGSKESAVKSHVADALISFCKQEEEFAQAIVQSQSTLSDCCKAIMNGVGNSISDLDVYAKAVKFYFCTAKIQFHMTIDLSGDNGYTPPPIKVSTNNDINPASAHQGQPKQDLAPGQKEEPKPKSVLNLSFDDLFDL